MTFLKTHSFKVGPQKAQSRSLTRKAVLCAFLWQTFDFIRIAPCARYGDAMLDFVAEATLLEIEKVMQCDFGFYFANCDGSSELTRHTAFDGGVVGGDASQHLLVRVVSSRLENSEKVSDDAVAPLTALTRGPDHPKLVSAATDRLLEIRGGVQDCIDVRVAVDPHWRKPERQRPSRDEQVLGQLGSFTMTQTLFREVVDVECRGARAGANLLEVEPPLSKELFAKRIKFKERLRVEEFE